MLAQLPQDVRLRNGSGARGYLSTVTALETVRFPTPELALRAARLRKSQQTLHEIVRLRAPHDLLRGTKMRASLKSAAFAVLMLVRMQAAINRRRKLLRAQSMHRQPRSTAVSRRGSNARVAIHATLSLIPDSLPSHCPGRSAAAASTLASEAVLEVFDGSEEDDDDDDGEAGFALGAEVPNDPGGSRAVRNGGSLCLTTLGGAVARFFPPRRDLAQLPELVVRHIEHSAAACLRRCLLMVRLRRVLNFHRTQRRVPSVDQLPRGALLGTCLDGWPVDALAELLTHATVERRSAGEFVYFHGEAPTMITIVLDGTVAIVERRNAAVKAASVARNGVVVARPQAPVMLRGAAVFVEEADLRAVQVTSLTDLISIPVRAIEEVFKTLPPAARDAVMRRSCAQRERVSRERDNVVEVLRWSPLFQCLSDEKAKLVGQAMEPRSFFRGRTVLDRAEDPHDVMFFVVRGTLQGVTSFRNARGEWADLVFAVWRHGDALGEKSLFFCEKHLFSLVAASNVDLWVLRRSQLQQLMRADRSLKQEVAAGAFSVRRSDPSVRMALGTTRNIPCIRAALQQGLLTESHVRKLHAMFTFAVFPANELITSSSDRVRHIIVPVTGTAVANALSVGAFVVPSGHAIGVAGLVPMRWRYPTLAATPCEGWRLDIGELLGFLDTAGVREAVCRLALEHHVTMLHSIDADTVMTVVTPPRPRCVALPVADGRGQRVGRQETKRSRFYADFAVPRDAGSGEQLPQPRAAGRDAKPNMVHTSSLSSVALSRGTFSTQSAADASSSLLHRSSHNARAAVVDAGESGEELRSQGAPSRRRSSVATITIADVAEVDADDEDLLTVTPRRRRTRRLSRSSRAVESLSRDNLWGSSGARRHPTAKSVSIVEDGAVPPELTPPEASLGVTQHSAPPSLLGGEVGRPRTASERRMARMTDFLASEAARMRASSASRASRLASLRRCRSGAAEGVGDVAHRCNGAPTPLAAVGSLRARMLDAITFGTSPPASGQQKRRF